ncbi:MAG: molybdopterin-guanine dinucleotide biosynthesis protein B [Candidatus Thorarchaeota archaeon]|jgi:molybdopterin-guanine dinucleotide biosynthesis protein B
MRVFAISGFSGTGKTTIVEGLVRALVESGYTVATIKSSKHDPGPESGTDTWKHRQAGASVALFLKMDNEHGTLRERLGKENLEKLTDYDFLVIEGMKSVDIPRFWCVGNNEIEPGKIPLNTQAIVSWSKKSQPFQGVPVIYAESIHELIQIIEEKALDISVVE